MLSKEIYVRIENTMNNMLRRMKQGTTLSKVITPEQSENDWEPPEELKRVFDDLKKAGEKEEPIYDFIKNYTESMAKNGNDYVSEKGWVKKGKFIQQKFVESDEASLSHGSWQNLRNTGKDKIKRYDGGFDENTLYRIILALQMKEKDALAFLYLDGKTLSPVKLRDRLFLAILKEEIYDIGTVYELFEEYGKNTTEPFDNIYPEPL